MRLRDEFLQQWKELTATVESSIIKIAREGGVISADTLRDVFIAEKNKWLSDSQYQGMWLKRLKKRDEAAGTNFERKLKEITLEQIKIPAKSSFLPYALVACALGVICFLVTRSAHLAAWKIAGTTILIPILSGSALYQAWRSKNVKQQRESSTVYLQQLEQHKQDLLRFCEKVDE
jgi:hypothetical protein